MTNAISKLINTAVEETDRAELIRKLESVHGWIVLIGNKRHAAIVRRAIEVLKQEQS